jgi:dihydroorotase
MRMSEDRMVIRGGRVLDPASGLDGVFDLWIRGGRIEKLVSSEPADSQDGAGGIGIPEVTVVEASGCYVMPGLIDLHVHLRDPGLTYKEDIATGGQAAARGGFTTVCCMANTKPVVDNAETVRYVVEKAAGVSPVHVIPVGAVTVGMEGRELTDMAAMKAAGAGAVSEDGKTVMDREVCRLGMERARDLGLVTMAHCEHRGMLAGGVMNEGPVSKRLGLPGFCNGAEDVIAARDILLAEETGARLHLCHCSTAGSVALLQGAKKLGLPVTGEACPHHFTLTEEAVDGADANFKMAPPLRTAEDVAAIRAGLADGTLDCISTDHAPHAAWEKEKGMREAPCGIIGLETAVALTVSELVRPGILTPMQMAEKMSYRPAVILGIGKGRLAAGAAADVTVIDPQAEYEIDKESFASRARNTPFHGRRVHGRVEVTVVDGRIVYEREGRRRG